MPSVVEPQVPEPGGPNRPPDRAPASPLDDPLISLVRSSPALAITVISAIAILARVLVVADFQSDTALALIRGAGLAGVLIGFAVIVVPYGAPLVAYTLVEEARYLREDGRPYEL